MTVTKQRNGSSAPDKATPASKVGKLYTWQQVAEHNSRESAWIIIDRTVYDITKWLDRHPGGSQHLLLAAGRDCTDLFASYHPFSDKPRELLHKFAVGHVESTEFPQFKPDTGFYRTLSQRVKAHFDETGKNMKDPVPGLVRLFFFCLTAFVMFYFVMNTTSLPWSVRIVGAIIYGIAQALPLLHSMHDASHTSIGNSPVYWRVIGRFTMDWMAGASMTSWHNQHVIGHHVYTNVVGADPDLPLEETGDLRRVAPQQTWLSRYKLQHVYLPILYGALAIKFRIQDVTALFTKTNGPIRVNQHGLSEPIWQLVTKSTWVFWRFLVPIVYWGVPTSEVLLLFLISDVMTGYWLAFNFQVSHVSPSVIFPDIKSGCNDEWAVAQVKTTVDYAHSSPMATLLCGALNYQIVHHLYPGISQYHYPAIAPIVKKTCKEFNVPYVHIDSFWTAFYLHLKHLHEYGMEHHH